MLSIVFMLCYFPADVLASIENSLVISGIYQPYCTLVFSNQNEGP